ncbi:MAG TPA: hypothetical protein VHW23_26420 [Kofleriaceae bacterium]|jgi:hypothetical protein|nr:hypothetical protein [Kofleriaceae bacterium]
MPVTTQTGEPPRHEVIYNRDEREVTGEQRADQVHEDVREDKISSATLAGGSSLELIGGGAAVVLAIIGLAGFLPFYMTAIAAIAIGGAMLAHGASVTARWEDTRWRAQGRGEQGELAGGIGSELLGGAAAILLGILALVGIVPLVLLPIAAIVVGGAILIGAPAQPPLTRLVPDRDRRMSRVIHEASETTSGAMVLTGLAAIVLGILALLRTGPVFTLVEVALLAVGGALLISGSMLTARFARRLHQAA